MITVEYLLGEEINYQEKSFKRDSELFFVLSENQETNWEYFTS